MKRLIALMLALTLALSAGLAIAEEEAKTIEEKFARQVQVSAYRGAVTFTATGSGSKAIDPALWVMIRSLAPRVTLSTDHSYVNRTRQGQATWTLTLDENTLAHASLLYDSQLMGLSSTLLAGDDLYYTADRGWNAAQALEAVAQGENPWPSTVGIILAAQAAPDAWKQRLLQHLTPYETKLGVWLNSYASFETGKIEDVSYTELSCAIPMRAVKTEIKQLMVDFYNDAEFLSLLREVVTPQEAAAYLQPGMMNSFFAMLDALDIEGEVEVVRRYSAQGKLLLDMMRLPFAPSSLLSSLTITLRPDEFGDCWGLAGETSFGVDFDVTIVLGEEMIYTGSVDLLLPPEENTDASYIVSDGPQEDAEPERRAVSFDYNLSWDPGEEIYTLANDQHVRSTSATLLIRPRGTDDLPLQTIALNYALSTGSSVTSSTQLNGALVWSDLESDASITATLESRTVSPTAVPVLSSVGNTLRVDQLSQENLLGLAQRWTQSLQANFQALLNRLTTSVFSFSAPVQ